MTQQTTTIVIFGASGDLTRKNSPRPSPTSTPKAASAPKSVSSAWPAAK